MLDAIDLGTSRAHHRNRILGVAKNTQSAPPCLAHQHVNLVLGQFFNGGFGAGQHGGLARHNFNHIGPITHLRPHCLLQSIHAIGLNPKGDAMPTRNGDGATRRKQAWAWHKPFGDGITQQKIELTRRTGIAHRRHTSIQTVSRRARRPQHRHANWLGGNLAKRVFGPRVEGVMGMTIDQAGQQGITHARDQHTFGRVALAGRFNGLDLAIVDQHIDMFTDSVSNPVDKTAIMKYC